MHTKIERPVPAYKPGKWGGFDGHLYEGEYVSYDDGKTWTSQGFSAQHSDECSCITDPQSFYGG